MKKLQIILFSLFIVSSVYVYVAQQSDDQSNEKVTIKEESVEKKINVNTKDSSIIEKSQPNNIIFFMTQNDTDINKPSGQYWPALAISFNGEIINNTSAFINDHSYSTVIEEKNIKPEKESDYLGYFIHPKTKEIIYLYGTKDKKNKLDNTDEDINSNNNEDNGDDFDDDDKPKDNN